MDYSLTYSLRSFTIMAATGIDHFRDIPMDCQTTDITHFAVVFHYDLTIKALETLRSTAKCL